MKEQKPKNIPFLLPCRCHLMCQHLSTFSLFLSSLIECVKKHSLSSSLPLSSHVSTSFYL